MKTTPIPVQPLLVGGLAIFSRAPVQYFTLDLRSEAVSKAYILAVTRSPIPNEQLTWLALGEDHAARSRRVEQLMALRGL